MCSMEAENSQLWNLCSRFRALGLEDHFAMVVDFGVAYRRLQMPGTKGIRIAE